MLTRRDDACTRGRHVTQAAIAITRGDGQWSGHEIDVSAVEDLDSFVDLLRDLADELALGFIEENDEYLGIVRVDGDGDPRVFLSDRRVLGTFALADRIFADALPAAAIGPDGDAADDAANPLLAAPAGDLDLLADLGTPADVLVELVAEGGAL